MSRSSDGVQSYPIPDLSTPEKTSAWIDQEMLNAQRYFREQVGMPKEVEAPALVIEEVPRPWRLRITCELGIVGTLVAVAGITSLVVYMAYNAFIMGVFLSVVSN